MSLARKQLGDSLMVVRNRNNNLIEECQKHLTMSLEKAKKRYHKFSEVNTIELNENGVVRKILLPPTITRQGVKKKNPVSSGHSVNVPVENRNEYSLSVVRSTGKAILPKSSVSNVSSLETARLKPSSYDVPNAASVSTNYFTFSQQNALTTSSMIQPYASISNSQSLQTVMINSTPLIINSQFNQQTRPFVFSTLQQQQQQLQQQQQPFIITQRAVTPNCNSSFILQQSPAQLPSFYPAQNQISQFQLVNQQPAFINQSFSPINQGYTSISQPSIFINQTNIQNAMVLTPQPKPLVLSQQNQIFTNNVQGLRSPVVVVNDFPAKFQSQQTQTFVLNQPMISAACTAPAVSSFGPTIQGAHVVEIAPVPNSAQTSCNSNKNAPQKSKQTRILPKRSDQNRNTASDRLESVFPDKKSLLEKIKTPAKTANNVSFMIVNKSHLAGDSGQPLKVQLVDRTPEKPTVPISVNSVEPKPKNMITLKRKLDKCEPVAKSPVVKKVTLQSTSGKESFLKQDVNKSDSSIGNNKVKENLKLNPKLVVSHVTGSADLCLTKRTPTVVLSPLKIQVNSLSGNHSFHLTSSNDNLKKTSNRSKKPKATEYRVIKPKPLCKLASNVGKNAKKLTVATTERKQIKYSQTADDLESDFAIAQILDKEEESSMWIDDDDINGDHASRKEDESELEQKKKRRGGSYADKPYKCHMSTKASEPARYPKTRSSRGAKRKA